MLQIYDSTQSYMELIKNRSPTPPIPLYFTKTSEVETNVYDEPVKELLVEEESRESTPEYKAVPVKSLINTFEQGKFVIAFEFRLIFMFAMNFLRYLCVNNPIFFYIA